MVLPSFLSKLESLSLSLLCWSVANFVLVLLKCTDLFLVEMVLATFLSGLFLITFILSQAVNSMHIKCE